MHLPANLKLHEAAFRFLWDRLISARINTSTESFSSTPTREFLTAAGSDHLLTCARKGVQCPHKLSPIVLEGGAAVIIGAKLQHAWLGC